jgi:hypothetical protein
MMSTSKTRNLLSLWDVVYVKNWPKDLKKGDFNRDFGFKILTDFYIVSHMRSHRYIDLVGNDLVLKTANGRNSQKWFFDNNTKTIKSRRTTSYSLELKSGGSSRDLRAYSTSSRWWQTWKFQGNNIRNMYRNLVVDVSGNKDEEGQKIHGWKRHNGAN